MKAILVIDIPDEEYGKFSKIGYVSGYTFESDDVYRETFYKYDLKPLPQKKEVDEQSLDLMWWDSEHDMAFDVGYNACLKDITGEE